MMFVECEIDWSFISRVKNLLSFFSKQDSVFNKYQYVLRKSIFSNYFLTNLSTTDEHFVSNSFDHQSTHQKPVQSQMSQFYYQS